MNEPPVPFRIDVRGHARRSFDKARNGGKRAQEMRQQARMRLVGADRWSAEGLVATGSPKKGGPLHPLDGEGGRFGPEADKVSIGPFETGSTSASRSMGSERES